MSEFFTNVFLNIKDFFYSLLVGLINLLPTGELPYRTEIASAFEYIFGAMKALNTFLPIDEMLKLFVYSLYLQMIYILVLGLRWFVNFLRGRK